MRVTACREQPLSPPNDSDQTEPEQSGGGLASNDSDSADGATRAATRTLGGPVRTNKVPSAEADLQFNSQRRLDIADELCEEMLQTFHDLRALAATIEEPSERVKAYDAVGKQGSRLHGMLNVAAIEAALEAARIEAAVAKMHGPKKSRRAMRQSDVEAKLAAAETAH